MLLRSSAGVSSILCVCGQLATSLARGIERLKQIIGVVDKDGREAGGVLVDSSAEGIVLEGCDSGAGRVTDVSRFSSSHGVCFPDVFASVLPFGSYI